MSEQRLLEVLSQVDDRFITEAAPGQREIKPAHWKKWVSLAASVCIVLTVLLLGFGVSYAAAGGNIFYLAGQLFQQATGNPTDPNVSDPIVAKYKDNEIRASVVAYYKELDALKNQNATTVRSDLEIINSIIETLILLEEAERLGLSATDEEIQSMVQNTIRAYENPGGKEMMDAYLAGSGMTFDEYLAKIEEQAPRTITRQKMLDHIGKQYCEEHGIEFTKLNPPAEMVAAQDAYLRNLFEQNKDNIEYYIDISTGS